MPELLDRLQAALADRYAVESELGRGGMATVFLAQDPRHDRRVAIKVLHPELAASLGTDRFLREIKIAARLDHPHILALFDSGEADRLLFYVMPYVEGESLRDRIEREGQLNVEEALGIATEVANGLAYAHEHGVVHRDIKPGNILLSAGHARVADFGVARAIDEAARGESTATGLAVGTPKYMSPEQAAGSLMIDGRSDVYALGCVLYEMLAGEPPFDGPTPQAILTRKATETVPDLRVRRKTIAADVEAVIARSMAPTPADRFSSADEFAAALQDRRTVPRRRSPAGSRITTRIATAVSLVVILAFAAVWVLGKYAEPDLDPNTIVVFPLAASGFPPDQGATEAIGGDVAITILQGMIYADPLVALEGALYLEPSEAVAPSVGLMQEISRSLGAGYFVRGTVRAHRDSVTVSVGLHNALGGSVTSERATGLLQEAELVGLRAFGKLLDDWIDPGRDVSLASLLERKPAALALWVQGERAFRLHNSESALNLYRRAIEEDSALALAAVKGALAANWEHNLAVARELVGVGLSHDSLLPPRYADLARGVQAYLNGSADSAVEWLEQATLEDPTWAEAHALLGETYYHFLPSGRSYPALAKSSFEMAVGLDSTFAPPLYHLIEVAVRQGDTALASTLFDQYVSFRPDTSYSAGLELLVQCASGGLSAEQWQAAAEVDALISAALVFSAAGSNPRCAEDGLRAALRSRSASQSQRSGALLGLQSVLVAQGNVESAAAMIDSAIAAGDASQMSLFVIDALAGVPFEGQAQSADDYVREATGQNYSQLSAPAWLWVFGSWNAHQGNRGRVESIRDLLGQHAAKSDDRQAVLFVRAMDAHLALLAGDTLGTIADLTNLVPTAALDALPWGAWESLPYERLLLARLLFSQREYADAYHVAAGFDHPEPVIYVAFVPQSLKLRLDAAERLGWTDSVSVLRNRLVRLGREDLVGRP